MRKIGIKLSFDELNALLPVVLLLGQSHFNPIHKALLTELYITQHARTLIKWTGSRKVNFTIAQALVLRDNMSVLNMGKLEPYTLAVVNQIYQRIDKELKQ